jgi:hypothetical protein
MVRSWIVSHCTCRLSSFARSSIQSWDLDCELSRVTKRRPDPRFVSRSENTQEKSLIRTEIHDRLLVAGDLRSDASDQIIRDLKQFLCASSFPERDETGINCGITPSVLCRGTQDADIDMLFQEACERQHSCCCNASGHLEGCNYRLGVRILLSKPLRNSLVGKVVVHCERTVQTQNRVVNKSLQHVIYAFSNRLVNWSIALEGVAVWFLLLVRCMPRARLGATRMC